MNQKIKNIGIFAHVDAGKTTLTEQLLFCSGAKRKLGRVDHGDTSTDSLELERERGISIVSMPTSYDYKGWTINVIDTPGHVDFIAEVERSMLVLDGAILVISAKEGVQSHTRLLFSTLKRLEIPTIIFVNKIDRVGVDIDELMIDTKKLTKAIIKSQRVHNQGTREAAVSEGFDLDDETIELLSIYDDGLIDDYLNESLISNERIDECVKNLVCTNRIYPVLFGSALKGSGVNDLLDKINKYLPSFKPIESNVTSGIVFKVMRYRGNRVTVIKLTAGSIKCFEFINGEKVTNIMKFHKGSVIPVGVLNPGEIAMVTGLKSMNVLDMIGDGSGIKYIKMGKPTLRVKLSYEKLSHRLDLLSALSILEDSDPYLSFEISNIDEIFISLFGYVQLEIIQETLKRNYKLDVEFENPMTILQERPKSLAESTFMIGKSIHPFRAGIGFRIEPLPLGEGIVIESEVTTGYLKKTFQNGLWDGVNAHIDQGLYGWELTDFKVTLIDYDFDSVSSTPRDYRLLSPLVLFDAISKVGTDLLWPVNEYTLTIPTNLIGRATQDLEVMKATMNTPMIEGNFCTFEGIIPQDSSMNYELIVQEYTSGNGSFEVRPSGYVKAPIDFHKERKKFKVDPSNKGKYILSVSNVL